MVQISSWFKMSALQLLQWSSESLHQFRMPLLTHKNGHEWGQISVQLCWHGRTLLLHSSNHNFCLDPFKIQHLKGKMENVFSNEKCLLPELPGDQQKINEEKDNKHAIQMRCIKWDWTLINYICRVFTCCSLCIIVKSDCSQLFCLFDDIWLINTLMNCNSKCHPFITKIESAHVCDTVKLRDLLLLFWTFST